MAKLRQPNMGCSVHHVRCAIFESSNGYLQRLVHVACSLHLSGAPQKAAELLSNGYI
jgi:hypothetical protein